MAIDTRDKRASALNVAIPWRALLPVPDAEIGSGDRAQAGLHYRGLSGDGAPQSPPPFAAKFLRDVGRLMGR